jgi:hypothetical protein
VFSVKTSPAVITILALFLLILFAAPSALAGTTALTTQERVTMLTARSDSLHHQLAKLSKHVRKHHTRKAVRRRLLRVSKSIRRVEASLNRLNRSFLAVDEADDTTVAALLESDDLALDLGRRALHLHAVGLLSGRNATVSKNMTTTTRTLGRLTKSLRHKKWQDPTPDPTPTATTTPTPTPTPTKSATSSPTPTPTKTATTSPTPTPTPTPTSPSSGPDVPAGYTLVQNQTLTNLSTNGLHDRYYYNCVFRGGTSVTGVLHFGGASYDLVFDSCEITAGPQNGITINDSNGRVHDITFKNCLIRSQPRMGFECTSRPTTASTQYQHVNVYNCTFEPQGNEAVSYDGGYQAGNCTFSGNVIKGAGNDPAQDWGAGFEINGPSDFTVTNNQIWQCRGSAWNLQRHSTAACGWVIKNNVLDASHHYQSTPMSSQAQTVLTLNVYGGVFSGNTVISAAPGGSVGYLSNSHNMDWRTTTWRDASGRAGYSTPMQASGCSGNQF